MMRRCGLVAMALVTVAAWANDAVNGTWKGSLIDPMGSHDIVLQLKVDGEKVTGTLAGGPPTGQQQELVDGTLKGDKLAFKVRALGPGGEQLLLDYKGKIAGNRIEGTHDAPMGAVKWEAAKN